MRTLLATAAAAMIAVGPAPAQQVTKGEIGGVRNFARLETTVACGGATKTAAIPELKKMGFKAVFNLRLSSEPGANVPEEQAAAEAAGLRYFHVPFTPETPNLESVDTFLKAIRDPANDPAFIHCSGGARAAGFWFLKRVMVDHWDTDRAMREAVELGLVNPKMKAFVLDYVASHGKRG